MEPNTTPTENSETSTPNPTPTETPVSPTPTFVPPVTPVTSMDQPAAKPGKALGIVGFILSFFFFLSVIGLILSIVALVKSKKAGQKNVLSIVGIILSGLNILATPIFIFTVLVAYLGVSTTADAHTACSNQSNIGMVTVNKVMFNCDPFGEMSSDTTVTN